MIGTTIDIAAAYLRAGEVVGIPTETVYGLACNALNPFAITKVFEVKERPFFDPLIIHVKDTDQINLYAELENDLLIKLAKEQMPGPLTLLLKKKDIIPDLITAGSEKVAIRIPSHPLAQKLLSQLDFPLAAPSANPFGYISPTTAKHVDQQLGNKIPYILDGGECAVGIESTIVGMEGDILVVYRKGGLSLDHLYQYTDNIRVNETSTSKPDAPGMLLSHYAPNCPIVIVKNWNEANINEQRGGFLTFNEKVESIENCTNVNLSITGDYHEAARNLFAALRHLDSLNLNVIYTKLLPEENLGIAINDRLRRAAVK